MSSKFENLPPEIRLKIFSYLSQDFLLTTVSLVCRSWHEIHDDPSFYRHMAFTADSPCTSRAVRMIAISPWLKTLQLSDRYDTDELLRHLTVRPIPRLEELTFRNCHGARAIVSVCSSYFCELLDNCPQLRYLSLENTHCECNVVFQEIGLKLPLLKRVHLGGEWQMMSTQALLNIVENCKGVEEVSVDWDNPVIDTLSSDAVCRFCDAFHNTLRVVNFSGATTWTYNSVFAMSKCRHLRQLNLGDARMITDSGLMSICHMPHLESLVVVSANRVTAAGWQRLLEAPSMSQLRELTLAGENVNDDVFATMASLRFVTNLTVYQTRHFTDVGIRAVGRMLSLENLYLPSLKYITDQGMMAITNLPNVRSLNLCSADCVTSKCWIDFFLSPAIKRITRLSLSLCQNVDDDVAQVMANNLVELKELQIVFCLQLTEHGCRMLQGGLGTQCCVDFGQ